jgi:hypothetical protein
MEIDEFERLARLDGVDVDAMIAYYEQRGRDSLSFGDLAISQVFVDMAALRTASVRAYILVEYILINPLLSLREVAEAFTLPHSTLNYILANASKTLPWLKTLLDLKKKQRLGGKRQNIQRKQTAHPALTAQRSRTRSKGTGKRGGE